MVVLRAFTEFNKIKYDCSKLIFLLYDGFMHLQADGLDYQPLFAKMSPHSSPVVGGGGELPYKSDGDGLRKTKIKPLRETNVGVAQSLTYP